VSILIEKIHHSEYGWIIFRVFLGYYYFYLGYLRKKILLLTFKVSYDIQILYSETLELFSLTEPNRIELNMGSESPEFFNISIFLWVRFDRTDLCFNAFEWSYMMYLMHLNDFYEFDRIELIKISKYWKNSIRFASIELIRLNSIRFDILGKF